MVGSQVGGVSGGIELEGALVDRETQFQSVQRRGDERCGGTHSACAVSTVAVEVQHIAMGSSTAEDIGEEGIAARYRVHAGPAGYEVGAAGGEAVEVLAPGEGDGAAVLGAEAEGCDGRHEEQRKGNNSFHHVILLYIGYFFL